MAAELQSRTEGQTLVLTIHNPAARNALGPEIYAAGIEALNVAGGQGQVRSCILTGSGSTFCAGGNLHRLQENRRAPPQVALDSVDMLHGWIEAVRAFPKPVIAAVEGAAAGAGFSLALACDFIVSADNAVFVMAHSSIGLTPDGGGTWSTARTMPRQLASELLMLGERIGPQRLQQLGIVNRITSAGTALDEALRLANRLNDRAPNAMAGIKELLADAPHRNLSEHLQAEAAQFVTALHHPNAGIGIDAFLAKQAPRYE